MKNSRLFQMLYLLMEHGELTAGWLAEKLEVSKRTVYRDLDALSAAGIPVYARQGQGGGICLMREYAMERTLLGDEEQEQILTALKSLETVGAIDGAALLTQLSGLFRKEAADWLEIEFESWGAGPREKRDFELCRRAILSHSLLAFSYFTPEGARTEREAEPYRLRFRGGNWYLYAWCRLRGGFRLFRLSRMQDICVQGERFSPRSIPEEKASADVPSVPVEILFEPCASARVLDSFSPEEITRLSDGSCLVCTAYPPGVWIESFLLSFGGSARVQKPAWLRERLRAEAEKISASYQT